MILKVPRKMDFSDEFEDEVDAKRKENAIKDYVSEY